jgi:hypothetical protein
MECSVCGGKMVGDGYNTVMHCEHFDGDLSCYEPDHAPIECFFERNTLTMICVVCRDNDCDNCAIDDIINK